MALWIWRVEGAGAATEGWGRGVALHLQFQPLTIIMIRRAGEQRRYLGLAGCPHCRPDGCAQVCPRALFLQLARTTLPGLTLVPVPRLAAGPEEVRRVVAAPHGPDAQPLDAAFLGRWRAGRLVTTWARRPAAPQPITVGAMLAVSREGPDLAAALQAAGWQVNRLGSLLARVARQPAIPAPAPAGAPAGDTLVAALNDPQRLWGPPALVSEAPHA